MREPNKKAIEAMRHISNLTDSVTAMVIVLERDWAEVAASFSRGDLVGAVRAQNETARTSIKIRELMSIIDRVLPTIQMADPDYYAEVSLELAPRDPDGGISSETLRRMIESHGNSCKNPKCSFGTVLEERLRGLAH